MKSIVTHDGKFHADEVVGISVLWELFPSAELIRTRDQEVLDIALNSETSIVVDVGGGEFDHHHRGFNLCRNSGELYSSAGLVWLKYGVAFVATIALIEGIPTTSEKNVEIAQDIDDRFIRFVDRHDNGIFPDRREVGDTTFSSIVSGFNPPWYTEDLDDNNFTMAVEFTARIMSKMVISALGEVLAEKEVLSAIEDQNNPRILILDKGMPWKPFIKKEHNAVFVVHPDDKGNYVALGVEGSEVDPKTNRRLLKKPFPESWRGLSDEALSTEVGLADMIFCHKGGFILVAKDLTAILGAVRMALVA